MKKLLSAVGIVFTLSSTLTLRADTALVFNEVMYHPATNEPAWEWVEFHNQLAVDLDVSEWTISGGINYTFPIGTVVKGRGYVVVALSPSTLVAAGVSNVLGPFSGRLSNNGELLILRNNSGREVDSLDYGVNGNWPVGADGAGVALAKRDRDTATADTGNWATSEQIGGTPGFENFPDVPPAVKLIAVDTGWKYDGSNVDLGTAWRENGYADGSWNARHSVTNRSIPDLFSTGVGNNGVALSPGTADPHYIFTVSAQGTNVLAIQNHSAWLANDSSSSWIGPTNPGTLNINQGTYFYQTRFSLDNFLPSTVRIEARVAVDNQLTNIFVNGTSTGLSHVGFDAFSSPLAITTGFVPGQNTLEFRALNDAPAQNPGAFRAALSSSGLQVNTNAPLPAGATTYYFRKAFVFSGDPAHTALWMNTIVSDGAIFYLNGVEIHRINMPAGAASHSTPALSNVTTPGYSGRIDLLGQNLASGPNVLAVEVHQAAGSPDAPLLGVDLFAQALPNAQFDLVFSEQFRSPSGEFWVELADLGGIDLDGFSIVCEGSTQGEYIFPPSTTAPDTYFFAITNSTLGFTPAPGDRLFLFGPSRTRLHDALVVSDGLTGRLQLEGRWLSPSQPTPGAVNAFNFRNEVVINEIMYNHQRLQSPTGEPGKESPEAWIELYNRSASPVDLSGWELTGGIQYTFSPGQTIQPGGYLVVADDVAYMRTLYPSLDVVGDFGGRLSGKSDRITLRDPSGNPADEVRYFDGGRWPGYADGGGSSLELRNPDADNMRAEAWAASDETSKSSWQTYTYRMPAVIPSGSGQPTVWNDFILGLLSGGECLVDDISVLESPTNNPVQFIGNGNFENGLTGWRVLGTHNRSSVIVDPDNAGNHVLHVVATGYQEHMHNHIETTYLGGRTATAGREYQVSFRAKWLAGNNLLNTRMYFNRVARTTPLPAAQLNGTPGAQNSRYEPNIGPTFKDLQHTPTIPEPGESVQISVHASDPQGGVICTLYWAVNGGAWNSVVMDDEGSECYATIPGYPSGSVVQFYVRAVDALGAAATYPANGSDSGALYIVNDGQAILPLAHNVRIIMSPANVNLMHGTAGAQTNVMSNDLLPCTVVYNERRAYYDVGVHLRGSQRGRYSDIRTGFHLTFQPDDLFLGVHPVMLIDRSGAGDATANRQEEIVLKHILNRAGGLPGTYSQICRVIAPRSAHTGPAQFFPRHEDVMIETAFENGNDGTQFEMELIYYPTTANAAGYKNPQPDTVVGTDITNLGDDKEIYRYNFMIKNHRDTDDYSRFIALAKAWSLTGAALDSQTRQLMDIDQWMRAYALVSLCSVGDMYTFGNNHNFFTYSRPSDGKFVYFPWDMDFAFTRGAGGALVGDQNLSKVVNLPGNLRRMYAHMLDIISVSFNTAYMAYWTDHYDNFAPGQSYAGSLSTIGGRVTFVQSTIGSQGGNSAFAVAGSTSITTSNNLLVLAGTAPIGVQTIRVNGREYPITWSSISAWRMVVPINEANTVLQFEGFDLRGNPHTTTPPAITVTYTGAIPDPAGNVVINEIMYNPVVPNTGFVELYNRSSFTFDLSGWRLNGVDYVFPAGAIITNGQYLLLANHAGDYAKAFGTNAPAPFDYFAGNLQNNGETLTLYRPGEEEEIVVDKVRYEDVPAWPRSPDGFGPSLQLIDASRDNSRVGNWSDGAGWRFFSVTGNPGANATNLLLFLASAGDIYVDNVWLVEGSEPATGPNLLANGDFESGDLGPWRLVGNNNNHSNTVVSSEVAYSGTYSLHIIAAGIGSPNSTVSQPLATTAASTTPHTFSFWYLPSTNGTAINYRLTAVYRSITAIPYRPVFSTPGAANSAARLIPAFPDLWLNEAQSQNLTGAADGQGEREPWVEIYNSGTSAISLDGFYLANNYTNLTQWAFPAGSSLAPGEFKIVYADNEPGESTAVEWHANFRLNAGAGSVSLNWTPLGQVQTLDYLNYTNLAPNWTYGAFPNGQPFNRESLFNPTPGGPNDNSGPPSQVVINEWMASNTSTILNTNNSNNYDDWFELYNPSDFPADLAGFYLTDNLANPNQFQIPQGYVIPPHGFLLVWADEEPGLNNTNDAALHVNFRLERSGEALALFASDGTLVNSVVFEPQFSDYSQGRFSDGGPSIYFLQSATPKAPNTSWANRYPDVAAIADLDVPVDTFVTFNVSASDPDGNALRFSLEESVGANIDANTGVFSWTSGNLPSTNVISILTTDNGTPALTTTRTFTVRVTSGIRIGRINRVSANEMAIDFNAAVGKNYRVDYKDALSDPGWTLGTPFQANAASMTINLTIGVEPQRFYRLVQVD